MAWDGLRSGRPLLLELLPCPNAWPSISLPELLHQPIPKRFPKLRKPSYQSPEGCSLPGAWRVRALPKLVHKSISKRFPRPSKPSNQSHDQKDVASPALEGPQIAAEQTQKPLYRSVFEEAQRSLQLEPSRSQQSKHRSLYIGQFLKRIKEAKTSDTLSFRPKCLSFFKSYLNFFQKLLK